MIPNHDLPCSLTSPFSSDGLPMRVGPDGMALPSQAAPPSAPVPSKGNDLEFTIENVDKVSSKFSNTTYIHSTYFHLTFSFNKIFNTVY